MALAPMHRSDQAPRALRAPTRAPGSVLVLALLCVVVPLAGPAAASTARLDGQGAPAGDWLVERASLEVAAIGADGAVDGARTRRLDGAGPVLLQNALGVELPGDCALVRIRTNVRQPRRLVRPCVSARAPPPLR